MVIKRGDVWWARLAKPRGSEPGYSRPVIIVSTNRFNTSNIRTVIAVAVTSNVQLAAAPGNVALSPADTGLPKSSVANVSQLLTVDKSFLFKRVGPLSSSAMQQIEDGMRILLGL